MMWSLVRFALIWNIELGFGIEVFHSRSSLSQCVIYIVWFHIAPVISHSRKKEKLLQLRLAQQIRNTINGIF